MAGEMFTDDFHGDHAQPLPAEFPKGYAAFYCMKHEITQQQYVEFLNALSFGEQADLSGGRPDAAAGTPIVRLSSSGRELVRNGIRIAVPGIPRASRNVPRPDAVVASVSKTVTPAVYETDAPHVACNWLLWSDGAAFAAWAGLRPMTELEFEKACRGPLRPVPDEYAWGTAGIAGSNTNKPPHDGYALENPGMDDERVVWEGANGPDATRGNAAWWGTVEKGKASYAVHAINGPLRAGIFATPDSGRVAAGASYWGIMELSGNLWEMPVTVGSRAGRRFAGEHGDGTTALSAGWHFITTGGRRDSGTSFRRRGGSFSCSGESVGALRVSDRWGGSRQYALRGAQTPTGFRCVRTAEEVCR
jgi:formylglycine-generating enzyme required for sulfatase activity